MMLALFAQTTELVPGLAPWAGLGAIGLILGWLLLVHLPAKDKQMKEFVEGKDLVIRELLVAARTEREKESEARDKTASLFQSAMSDLARQHELDATNDRTAFEHRSERMVDAITKMSLQFENAIMKQTDKLELKLDKLSQETRSSCMYAGETMRFQQQPKKGDGI